MSRISRQSSFWLSSFRASGNQAHSLRPQVCRNRVQSICTSLPCRGAEPASSSTASSSTASESSTSNSDSGETLTVTPKTTRRGGKPKAIAHMKASDLDSLSNRLISDLYLKPSSKRTKVTIQDVLALRPPKSKVSPEEFDKIKELVAASFNVTQLKDVLRSTGIPVGRKKDALLNQTMALMRLEVVATKSKKAKLIDAPFSLAGPNVESEVCPSNRRDLYFILGVEGDSLRKLEKEKNVQISINIADESFMIQGAKDSIAEAKKAIEELVVVTEEPWEISGYEDKALVIGEPAALEDIARRSGTFVSAENENTLVISGRSTYELEEAKRLFDLKMQKPNLHAERLAFIHQEDELKYVGMFPVYDSISMTPDEAQKSYFRVCQVDAFADTSSGNEGIHPVMATPTNIEGTLALRDYMRTSMEKARKPGQSLELAAHFGQVLFRNVDSRMNTVPIPTPFDSLDLEQWLKTAEDPFFFESLPFFKAVSRIPLVGSKTRTIDVEYVPTAWVSSSPSNNELSDSAAAMKRRVHITLEMNDQEESVYLHNSKFEDRQLLANMMMLGQPTDIQIRSGLSTRLGPENRSLKELLSKTTLLSTSQLECPRFFSFGETASLSSPSSSPLSLSPSSSQPSSSAETPSISSTTVSSSPIVSQLGLATTHTLKSVQFKTTGVFNFMGLPLVASDIRDQHSQTRKQELKLLPIPFSSNPELAVEQARSVASLTESDATLSTVWENWGDFVKTAMQLNRSI
ncbi:hypothetical protein BGW38_008015 [Lunasporangiospora selenospora]|uniref:K Homology domain-containing protein n=1 Tax=Lunasporangiospora selenospora TaxID=979761 RepID=A0A9P6G373_9FUNG|nr:hypothetical protein BGW38_008015 [Lunasporangiospora selenospora]